jgi:octaprenyl-diphosphate synthase
VQFQALKEKLESLDAISYTQNKAKEDVVKAEQALAIFDASASKTILTLIANYAVHRKV